MKAGSTDWNSGGHAAANREIEGYASATSVNRGDQIRLYVNTAEPGYTIDVYRMGWYGGAGARKVLGPVTRTGIAQPMPQPDPVTGLIECNWTDPFTITIPDTSDHTDWASGVYLAKLVSATTLSRSYIIFVVRDDTRPSTHNVQTSVTTYQAYNNWGGKSLYAFNSTGGQAAEVSFNRPYAGGGGTGDFLYRWEYNMLRFVEREGYDVTYSTDIDTHSNAALLRQHRDFLSAGHDEYWSWEMRANVTAARDAGVNLGFFTADACYWQIRLAPGRIDPSQSNRTIVAYKENYKSDPYYTDADKTNDDRVTTMWRGAPVNRSEDQFIGVRYIGDPVNGDIVIDDVTSAPWVFTNTGLTSGSHLPGLLGYEVDKTGPKTPAGTIRLGHSPFTTHKTDPSKDFSDHSDMTVYTAPSGAVVFATGTIQWAWGLDNWNSVENGDRTQNGAQQITRNVLRTFAGSAASNDCQFLLTPPSAGVPAAGGTTTLSITTQCGWSAAADVPWISGISQSSGSGNADLTYAVSANTEPSRTGHIHVGDRVVTVVQASGCTFTLSPSSASYGAAAGSGSFTVTASDAACMWSADPLDPWIAITTVNGSTVTYGVTQNSGAPRTGTIDVEGQTFTITQANGCTYTVGPQSVAFETNGGSGTINVTTDATCYWKASVSTSYPWITIANGADQKGSGAMAFSVAANTTGSPRTGRLSVAGTEVTVSQSGVSPPAAVSFVDARATGASQITVSWTASPGATSYEVYRSASLQAFALAGTSSGTTFVDGGVTAGSAYLYLVRAVNASGSSPDSYAEPSTAIRFSGDPIAARVTVVRAAHIPELRDAVNAVRVLANLPRATFTGTAAQGTLIGAAHVSELRNRLDEAMTRLALPTGGYANIVVPGSIIRAIDIQELRERVR
jgi:hypothetical protein